MSLKKRVIICDDEADSIHLLRQYASEHSELEVIHECMNGIDSVRDINSLKPDLVFLDISMPGLDGFQVLNALQHHPQVIFSTAYDSYAIRAFDKDAVDYLLKPFARERFRQAVRKALLRSSKVNTESSSISIPETILAQSGDRMISVFLKDIIWIEADGDYSRIHVGNKFYLSNSGMNILEERLSNELFIRIHRSAIVNINMVAELSRTIRGCSVILKNGYIHKVGRNYLKNIKKLIV